MLAKNIYLVALLFYKKCLCTILLAKNPVPSTRGARPTQSPLFFRARKIPHFLSLLTNTESSSSFSSTGGSGGDFLANLRKQEEERVVREVAWGRGLGSLRSSRVFFRGEVDGPTPMEAAEMAKILPWPPIRHSPILSLDKRTSLDPLLAA